jgi:predicted amidohydrolase
MKIALIQMNSVADKAANIAQARELIERAVELEKPDWVLLPEHFDWSGGTTADKVREAEEVGSGPASTMARELAAKHKIWIHAGSLLERVKGENRVHNTTVVYDRSGKQAALYRKIHLFDITAPDGTAYKESASVKPGREIVTYDCEGITVGCTICYDLRFPELFQALTARGAQLIALPASFTLQTGKDHWEVLCRARAIETETYFAACGQTGTYMAAGNEKRFTYGHSLVADPWGHVIAKASDGVGFVTARIDPARIAKVRQQIPVAEHKVIGRDMAPVTLGKVA